MFFNIRIDSALLTYLSSHKLRLEELFVIACLIKEDTSILKKYLGGLNSDQLSAYFQTFERKMLVKKLVTNLTDFDWDNYELTERADQIYDDCKANIFTADGGELIGTPPVKLETPKVSVSKNDDFVQFMIKFLDLWPEGVRNMNGDRIKSNEKDIIDRMVGFMRKYKYDYDVILRATEAYLIKQRNSGYTYCNQAFYFIMKDRISKLATECDAILSGKETASDDGEWINNM